MTRLAELLARIDDADLRVQVERLLAQILAAGAPGESPGGELPNVVSLSDEALKSADHACYFVSRCMDLLYQMLHDEQARRFFDTGDPVRTALLMIKDRLESNATVLIKDVYDVLESDAAEHVPRESLSGVSRQWATLSTGYTSLCLTPPPRIDASVWAAGLTSLFDRWSELASYPQHVTFPILDDQMLRDGPVRMVWNRATGATLIWVDQLDGPNTRFRGPDLASGLAYLSQHHPFSPERSHCV